MIESARARPANAIGIALTAASVLAYQIVLMRTFAIESYASFGAMVISVALLGFGISGTLLTVFRDALLTRRDALLYWSAVLSVPLLIVAHFLQQQVPFVPGKMLGEPSHVWWLTAYYGLTLLPMLSLSVYVGVTLVGFTRDVHKLYFADLAASGAGAFAVLGLLYVVPPQYLILIPVVPAAVGGLVVATKRWERIVGSALLALGIVAVLVWGDVRFNEYKSILGTLRTAEVTGAKVIDVRFGPMGYIQVVDAGRSARTAPGYGFPSAVLPPVQHQLYVDGSRVGYLARAISDEEARYHDNLMSALPYQLLERPKTLVLGVVGGLGIAEALHHGSERVVGVTSNPQLVSLMEDFSEYNGNLLHRDGVEVVVGEGRALAHATDESFDLVVLKALDSSGLSTASAPGVTERYALTVEAFQAYFRALTDRGIVSVQMRFWAPDHQAIRLLPTVAAALRAEGHSVLGDKVIFVRDHEVALCLVRPSGFDAEAIKEVRRWSRARSFDVSYFPGVTDDDLKDPLSVLPVDIHPEAARAVLLAADGGAKFLEDYLFDIGPTTDDRPYFGAAVKLGKTLDAVREYQRKSVEATANDAEPAACPAVGGPEDDVPNLDGDGDVPNLDTDDDVPDLDGGGDVAKPGVADKEEPAAAEATPTEDRATDSEDDSSETEEGPGIFASLRGLPPDQWGVYVQIATLLQALAFGLLIVLIPLVGARRGILGVPGKAAALVYFACLGFGFMCAEMVFIRKITLLLASPVYSVTVVLASILFFAGLGSARAGRFTDPKRAITVAVVGAASLVLVYVLALDPVFRLALGLPTFVRILLAVALVAPVAFFLGFPFPTGMAALDRQGIRNRLVPWAWAINGATSVVAAVGVELASTHFGFRMVLLAMVFFYSLAWVTFPGRWREKS